MSHTDPTHCKKCFRVLSTDKPDTPVCGCAVTETHTFVKGTGMRTYWVCGRGGSEKIHRVA